MDNVIRYQQIIKEIIQRYVGADRDLEELESQLFFDDDGGHYYLMRVG